MSRPDPRHVERITRSVQFTEQFAAAPQLSNRHRGQSGGQSWIDAILTSRSIFASGQYRYSWKELAWDETKNRLAVKENGQSADRSAPTGYAVERQYNSQWCLPGQHVKLIKQGDFYLFEQPSVIHEAKLAKGAGITKSTATYASGVITTNDKTLGSGTVTVYYVDQDAIENPYVYSDNKYSMKTETITAYNSFAVSVPPYVEDGASADRDLMLYIQWINGRWNVVSAMCNEE